MIDSLMKNTILLGSLLATLLFLMPPGSAQVRDKVGITDRNGKTVVPCDFARAEYLGQGLFYLEEFNQLNPTEQTFKGHVVDHDGNTVPVNIPPGCTISKVYVPGSFGKENGLTTILPAGAIIQLHGPNGYGLCRPNGEIVLEPEHYFISYPNAGFFPVIQKVKSSDYLSFTVDSATGARVQAPAKCSSWTPSTSAVSPFQQAVDHLLLSGYLARNGTVVIKPRFFSASEFSADGLARVSFEQPIRYAFINKAGEVISPKFRQLENFVGDLAIAGVGPWGEKKLGLIDRSYQFVLPQRYFDLTLLFPGIYSARLTENGRFRAISPEGKTLFLFPEEVVYVSKIYPHCITCGVRSDDNKSKSIYLDRTGKQVSLNWPVIEGPALPKVPGGYFQVASADRLIKYVEDNHFYPEAFKHPNSPFLTANRLGQFAVFLKNYDLIGMDRKQVQLLLGGTGDTYVLAATMCGKSTSVEFEYENDKVVGWRENHIPGGKSYTGPWITKNMIVDSMPENRGGDQFLCFVLKPKPAGAALVQVRQLFFLPE